MWSLMRLSGATEWSDVDYVGHQHWTGPDGSSQRKTSILLRRACEFLA